MKNKSSKGNYQNIGVDIRRNTKNELELTTVVDAKREAARMHMCV